LHRRRLSQEEGLQLRRNDHRRLARRTNATKRGPARHDDRLNYRPARIPRNERASVARPHQPQVPLADRRA
jgi:hypothetical protein